MTEILIITNYFPPETGAAANRIMQLAQLLQKNGRQVTVFCPLPNYPTGKLYPGYKNKLNTRESVQGISAVRFFIWPSASKNPLVRLFSTASLLLLLSLKLLFSRLPKDVVVQSPPLLLSFVCCAILRLRRRKIILNVSDLWPLAAVELQVIPPKGIGYRAACYFERKIYGWAQVILGQSEEILTHIKSFQPKATFELYRNFPEFTHETTPVVENAEKVQIFYAGLLGVAQGIYRLLTEISFDANKVEIHVFGAGAEQDLIRRYLNQKPNCGIYFHGNLSRSELQARIEKMDFALVPLVSRIYGSVPSKIFEYSKMGFPLIYMGGGEGSDIVRNFKLGYDVETGDYKRLSELISQVAQLDSAERLALKSEVYHTANRSFNAVEQFQNLAVFKS
ncbi:glycosyltransferase family 4 protein [Flavobacterium sp.]|uniref:glycosyltransferase family 4 protein n=1 Tax=Flavobacterium sp. TaxID=239 RepID=UPI002628A0BB|nr:glycosyltransferase family 4 protein [Flavobacterium sp.]